MIVATAGHIDHGKTTLVRALTGIETDRLPQEKARGISIDIGFAYWRTPAGEVVGFIDVPGHERFIHNMLAGVANIDFALLVVAADDGVMPQTREHLNILDLFGVTAGLAVLTKTDRVPPERVAQVRADIAVLLAGTSLAGAPALEVCAPTGSGIPALQQALAQAAAQCASRDAPGRGFRFTIDRSFSAPGSGTVVTGTVLAGEVRAGDRLQLSPQGPPVRVRGLHQHGRAVELAVTGERCAINIAGADPRQASRGLWLVAPHGHAPTDRIDALVRVLPANKVPLRHWDPVHFHIGTADVLARLVMPGAVVAPGESALVQFALDKPVAAVLGDRFVIRDPSARHTLGGGSVLDPFAHHPKRQRAARAARLAALREPGMEAAWSMLLHQGAGGVPVQAFRRTFNLTPAAMRGLLERSGAALPGGEQGNAFGQAQLHALETALLEALRQFHAGSPHAAGIDTDRLLRTALPTLAQRERMAVLRAMAEAGTIEVRGSLVRLPGHRPAARSGDDRLRAQLAPLYAQWGANVPLLREVSARSGIDEPALRDLLKHLSQTGAMVRVAPERFLPRPALAQLAQAVVRLSKGEGRDDFTDELTGEVTGEFTVAQYRDFTGIGRNLAIEVLEYFDKLGLTQRSGNARAIRCLDEQLAAALGDPGWDAPRFTVPQTQN